MCRSENFSLKLICLTCLLIIFVDSYVLYETLLQYSTLKTYTTTIDAFDHCYRPQLLMRILFTLYAINAALICLFLTLILCFSDLSFDLMLTRLLNYTYLSFGPVLLLLTSAFGIPHLEALALYECTLNGYYRSENVNFMDAFAVVAAAMFALGVTMMWSVQNTV